MQAEDYLKEGQKLSNSKQYEDAIIAYDKAIELNPNFQEAYFHKGIALRALEQYEAAIQAYDKIIELNPNLANVYFHKGMALFSLKQDEATLEAYDKAIQLKPDFANFYFYKGLALHRLERCEDALKAYDKTVELSPQNAKAYFYMAHALQDLEQYESALKAIDKSIELAPNDKDSYHVKSNILSRMGESEGALQAIDKAIELNPEDPIGYNSKGERFMEIGNYNEALECYNKCIELDPENPYAYGNKGFAQYHLGRFKKAIKNYDKQIKIEPESFMSYAKKGIALYDLEQTQEASDCFNQATDLIKQGTIRGMKFIDHHGRVSLMNKVEAGLIEDIKDLSEACSLSHDKIKSKELQGEALKLEKKKEDLKIKAFKSLTKKKARKEDREELRRQIQELKQDYADLHNEVAEIAKDLEDAGVKELAEIKRGFHALEDQDPELLAYCKTFYWTLINLFSAYRNASTGLMKGDLEKVENEHATLANGVKAASKLVGAVAQGVPIVGNLMQMLDSVIDNITKEKSYQNKVNAINRVIQAKFGTEDDISLNVAKVALAITRAKEQGILYPETTPPSKFQARLKWLEDKIDAIKERILPSVELYDPQSNGAALALQDVALVTAYLCKNSDAVIKRKEPFDKQIEALIKYNGLESLLESSSDEKKSVAEEAPRKCCVGCMMF